MMGMMAMAASEGAVALAGSSLGSVSWGALPWGALPWREGALLGLPFVGTAAARLARRFRR